jgi:hypothetical protein
MAGLATYDHAEAEDCDVLAALCKLFCGLCNFTGSRHPDHRYLFVSGAVAPETIYRTGKQLGGYEFVEPADYNGVTALAGRNLTFYFLNHIFASPKTFRCRRSQTCRHQVTPQPAPIHYKTINGCFPEKQGGTKAGSALDVSAMTANLFNYKRLYPELPAEFHCG